VESVGNWYWIVEEIVQAGCILNFTRLLSSMQEDSRSFINSMLLTVWSRPRSLGTRKRLLRKFQLGPLAIVEDLGREIALPYAGSLISSTGSTRGCQNALLVKSTTLEVP